MKLNASQIRAILSLLSESDKEIVAQIRKKLFEMGEGAVREVLQASGAGTRARREMERVLYRLGEPPLEEQFRNLPETPDGDIDLEAGAFTLAKLGYPDIEIGHYRARLDRMASDLAPNIASDDHPLRAIHTLNGYLFGEQGFHGHRTLNPDNSYLNRVIERKQGLPIALSAIYILLARRLELPIVGIDMQAHFIVKYKASEEMEILIDPFNGGQVLTKNACAEILARFQVHSEEVPLPEATNRRILVRMMHNLVNSYTVLSDQKRAEALFKFVQILQ
jgi:regulator of sirC expression with transglutaminase-like and TPR domain